MKYIFGIGLLGALFSTCFGFTGVNSMFSIIRSDGQTYGVIGGYNSGYIYYNYAPNNWFTLSSIPDLFTNGPVYYSDWNISPISENFLSPYGFSITGINNNGSISLLSSNSTNSLYKSLNVDYTVGDSFPFVVDETNGSYLTFENDSTIIYNGQSFPIINQGYVHYCFYGIDLNLSCLVTTPNSDPGFKFISFGVDNSFNFHQYNNYAIIPIHKQNGSWTEYTFTGYGTLVLSYGNYNSMQNLGIIWNYFDCYSSDPEVLKNCTLGGQGYINLNPTVFFNRSFVSILGNSSYVESYGYGTFAEILQTGANFIFRTNSYYNRSSSTSSSSSNIGKNCNTYASCFGSGTLPLISDSSVDNILEHNSNQPVQVNSGIISSSMYYECLGPVYNTPDGLPPEFCYNSLGELDPDRFRNCYDAIDSNNDYYHYCVIDGYVQSVALVPDGSGYAIVSHDGPITNILDILQNSSFVTTGYFENYLNTTGYFFKCPWPYDNNLTIWPKLVTFLNGYDLLLPINCGIAGFSYGRNIINFENSGHFVPDGPLLNFDGDNRKMLYLFFDIVMSLGIVIFAGKLFYLFHK